MIHLFRPLVRLELDDGLPLIHCREVAIGAAEQVVKISAEYRRLFPTRTVVIFWTHILLSSGTLLLLDLPAQSHSVEDFTDANRRALRNVGQILEHLSNMSDNHHLATRCAGIIRGRARELGLMLPDVGLKNQPQQVHNGTSDQPTCSKSTVNYDPAFGSTAHGLQSSKSEKFPLDSQEIPRSKVPFRLQKMLHSSTQPRAHSVTLGSHNLEDPSLMPAADFQPCASYPASSTLHQDLYHPPSVPLMNPDPSIFWSPDGNGLPLYNIHTNNTNTSPMSVFNIMEPIPTTDALVRDGFKVSNMWGNDPFGAHGHSLHHDMMGQASVDEQQFAYQQPQSHSW